MENTSKGISGTVIVVCECAHIEQDNLYGKNKRVANYKGSSTKDSPRAVCTVCGKEHHSKFIKIN